MAARTVRDKPEERPSDSSPAYFLVMLGADQSLTQRLPTEGSLDIGRDEHADVRVVDALASRAHARLHLGKTLEIEDLGSANGTRLRDEPIESHRRMPFSPGDAITIGTTLLVVQSRKPSVLPRRI